MHKKVYQTLTSLLVATLFSACSDTNVEEFSSSSSTDFSTNSSSKSSLNNTNSFNSSTSSAFFTSSTSSQLQDTPTISSVSSSSFSQQASSSSLLSSSSSLSSTAQEVSSFSSTFSSELSSAISSKSSSSASPNLVREAPLLVIRVNYKNEDFINNDAIWNQIIFGNSEAQLNHYMREISNNNFSYKAVNETFSTQNDGLITVFLNKNHPDSGADASIHSDLAQALIIADDFIDYSQYDTNLDGALSRDEFIPMFIIAGNEDAYSGANSDNGVWAHQSCTNFSNAPTLDGVRLMSCNSNGVYAVFGERHNDPTIPNHDATIGIIAHELGHASFGLPDLYDTTNESAGIGYFGLMGAGIWGQKSFQDLPGTSPSHMCAWSKIESHFIQAEELSAVENSQISLTESASDNYNIIKVPINSTEYFLLENRNKSGYDRGLFFLNEIGTFQGGLAIWHIDETVLAQKSSTNSVNNNPSHKAVDLEDASQAELDSGDKTGNSKNLYFSTNVSVFSSTTSPNSNSYDNTKSFVKISDISAPSEVMSATITNPN